MSRTLLEWLEARDEWRTAQGYRINSLPMPGPDSVVYERESTNEFWHKRWDHAKGLIPGSSKLSFTEQQIVDFIDAAADIEATKEEEFLDKFFPDRTGTDTIEQFNILF